jgi:hypothetical protein
LYIEQVARTYMTGLNRYTVISNMINPRTTPNQPNIYEIRVKGHLGHQWTEWFGGLTITLENDGVTLLTGPLVDQAAMYGLLKKLSDLGMLLLSVNRVEDARTDALDVKQ